MNNFKPRPKLTAQPGCLKCKGRGYIRNTTWNADMAVAYPRIPVLFRACPCVKEGQP